MKPRALQLLFVIIGCLPALLFAEVDASTLSIANQEHGTMSFALAGATNAYPNNPTGFLYNPALTAAIKHPIFHLQYSNNQNNLFHHGLITGILPIKKYGFVGGAISLLSTNSITSFNKTSAVNKTKYNDTQMKFEGVYGYRFPINIMVGGSIQWEFQKVDEYFRNALSINAGVYYQPLPYLHLGLSVIDAFSYDLKAFSNRMFLLTQKLRFGISLAGWDERLVFNADIQSPIQFNTATITYSFGGCFEIVEGLQLFLGFGNSFNGKEATFSGGLSYSFKGFDFLGGIQKHPIGFSGNFGVTYIYDPPDPIIREIQTEGPSSKQLIQAISSYDAGEYGEATTLFEEILLEEPDNEVAQRYLKRSLSRLDEQDISEEDQEEIDSLLQEVDVLVEQERFADALNKLVHIFDIDPKNQQAKNKEQMIRAKLSQLITPLQEEAVEYFNNEDFESALHKLNEVLALDPTFQPALDLLAQIREIQQRSIEDYEERQTPEEIANRYFNEGQRLYFRDDFELAIEKFKKALQFYPEHPEAQTYLSRAESKLQQLQNQAANRALAEERKEYGLQLIEQGHFKEGLLVLREATVIDPTNMELREVLEEQRIQLEEKLTQMLDEADNQMELGNITDAFQLYNDIITIDPDSTQALASKQRMQDSKSRLQQQLERLVFLGEEAFDNQNYEDSLRYYNEAIQLDREDAELRARYEEIYSILDEYIQMLFDQGLEQYESQKYEEAIAIFEEVLDLDAQNVGAREMILEAKNQLQIIYKNQSLDEFLGIAEGYFENREFQRALNIYKHILNEVDPEHPLCIERKVICEQMISEAQRKDSIEENFEAGVAQMENNQYREAIAYFENALELVDLNKGEDNSYLHELIDEAEEELNLQANEALQLARENQDRGDYAAALEQYLNAYEKNPSESIYQEIQELKSTIQRKIMEQRILAEQKFDAGKYSDSLIIYQNLAHLQEQIQSNSAADINFAKEIDNRISVLQTVHQSFETGRTAFQDGDMIAAASNMEKVLEYNQNDSNALNIRNQAVQELRSNMEQLMESANQYRMQRNFTAAMERYKIVLSIDENNQLALHYYKQSERLLQDFLENNYQEGIEAFNRGEYELAIDRFNKVASVEPGFKDLMRFRSEAEQNMQRIRREEEARLQRIAAAREAAAIRNETQNTPNRPTRPSGQPSRPQNNQSNQSNANAANQNQNTASGGPSQNSAQVEQLFNQGLEQYQNGNYTAAIAIWRRCLVLDPSNSQIQFWIKKAEKQQ